MLAEDTRLCNADLPMGETGGNCIMLNNWYHFT
jgi:hypothetical protein